VITRGVPALEPWQAAVRASRGAAAVWATSPGSDGLAAGPTKHFVAADPYLICSGGDLTRLDAAWTKARARWQSASDTFCPVAFGYLSYELGARWSGVEPRQGGAGRSRDGAADPAFSAEDHKGSPWPEFQFRFFDAVWVFDSLVGQAQIVACDEAAAARLSARLTVPIDRTRGAVPLEPLKPVETEPSYLQAVERIQRYLQAGDAYQVNLARRLRGSLRLPATKQAHRDCDGLDIAIQLHERTPAPHALWLGPDQEGRALIGNSPERFLRVEPNGLVETCPIKGTRPRGEGRADTEARRALLTSSKDAAEHLMIVDLERNDLGRICQTGSVHVPTYRAIVSYPTVHHLVSVVRGQLQPGVDLERLLKATFPGGSITGAPKRRAMEIIRELEPAARGPYTGATGWLGAAGDMDLAVAIRTATVAGWGHPGDGSPTLQLWVGGGIVADSEPLDELRETRAKAAAFTSLASGAQDTPL